MHNPMEKPNFLAVLHKKRGGSVLLTLSCSSGAPDNLQRIEFHIPRLNGGTEAVRKPQRALSDFLGLRMLASCMFMFHYVIWFKMGCSFQGHETRQRQLLHGLQDQKTLQHILPAMWRSVDYLILHPEPLNFVVEPLCWKCWIKSPELSKQLGKEKLFATTNQLSCVIIATNKDEPWRTRPSWDGHKMRVLPSPPTIQWLFTAKPWTLGYR